MEILFKFKENENLNIKTISVIGDFNNYNSEKGKMIKENGDWTIKINLKEGEHKYKFLINNELKLNDPMANIYFPDDNEELWSVIIINENDQRLYNNNQYSVHIDSYNITSNVNNEENFINKKIFNILLDKKVVTRFAFSQITGIHSVTIAWYTPVGELYEFTENNLFNPEENINEQIKLWFWIDLEEKKIRSICGDWSVKLFIDGEFILEDKFKLSEGNLYSSQGKFI